MSIFKGIRTKNGAFVTYNDFPLDLRLDIRDHSPMGFEWGYNGSGARQLALAILTKFISDELTIEYYDEFCKTFIESINNDDWEIKSQSIQKWLTDKRVAGIKPILTPRFNLISTDNKNFNMFLDDKKLGSEQNLYNNYNTHISLNQNIVYCEFSEIKNIKIKDLPSNVFFNFLEYSDSSYHKSFIVENLKLYGLNKSNNKIELSFWYSLQLEKFIEEQNPILLMQDFSSRLDALAKVDVTSSRLEDGIYMLEFLVFSDNNNQALDDILSNEVNALIKLHSEIFNNQKSDMLEAIFELPKAYKGITKQYLMYFEEFLNDLSIQAEVNIEQKDLETVLKITPKNKNEALEKILKALQIYISAPVISRQIETNKMLEAEVAINKLQSQCMHLESQIMLKNATIIQQYSTIKSQNLMIENTKDIFYKAGFELETISNNKMLLIDSLKKVNLNGKDLDKKTFFSSFRAAISLLGNKCEIELKRKKL